MTTVFGFRLAHSYRRCWSTHNIFFFLLELKFIRQMESGSKWIYRRQANDGIIFDQPECTLKLLFLFVYTVYIDCMMMCIRQLYDCQIKWAIFT